MKCDELKRETRDVDYGLGPIPVSFYDADKVDDAIAELKAENESLKYSVAALDTDIAMMKRWRKFIDEKPSEEMEGEDFLVSNGYYSVVCEWRGYWNNEPFCGDKNCDVVKYWMPLPSVPKEANK